MSVGLTVALGRGHAVEMRGVSMAKVLAQILFRRARSCRKYTIHMKLRYKLRRVGEICGGCSGYDGRRQQWWTANSCRIVDVDHTSGLRRRWKCARSDHMRLYAVVQLLA